MEEHDLSTARMSHIAAEFASYFATWGIELPAADLAARRRGSVSAAGWSIQYLFGADAQGKYLDFYATHRMTNERHLRIYASGTIEYLPTMHEFTVFPAAASPEDKARIEQEYYAHNRAIGALLRAKGFGL